MRVFIIVCRTRWRGGHGPLPAVAWKAMEKTVRGFWYRNQRDGVDDGREGLQTPLSALGDSAAI